LLSAGLSLVEIAHTLGFASQSHFNAVFQSTTGTSPGRFRRARAVDTSTENGIWLPERAVYCRTSGRNPSSTFRCSLVRGGRT
jgi:AraC-like DNA-binding protein